MLEYLRIRNLALISDVELEFGPGLNALTGETGAGKSFILKALNFLTGDKLSADMVRPGEEKATVDALFAMPDGDVIIRRELSAATGRSRVYVNDNLSSQESVRAMRPDLILHTSQHGQQKLLQPSYQCRVIDAFLPPGDGPSPVAERDRLVFALRDVAHRREELEERIRGLQDRRDLLEHQQGIIEKVAPEPGEEEELEARKQVIRSQSSMREAADRALSLILSPEHGLLEALGGLGRELSALADVDSDFSTDVDAVEEARQTLRDLDGRLRQQQSMSWSEDDIEGIESRLYELAQLKRQLKRSLDEIISLQEEIAENLSFLDASALDLKQLQKEEQALAAELAAVLKTLNAARHDAAERLCGMLITELKDLGFSEHVQVHVQFTPTELHPGFPGLTEDRPRILWVPNPGQTPQPLDKIASGGELSRFLLAVVGLLARNEHATLIFDEVDAGVGGITLNAVADKLKKLAGERQMILISHWPQLAALAETHFFIRKEVEDGQTYTRCTHLAGNSVFQELARMAGGGEQGRAMAEELLRK